MNVVRYGDSIGEGFRRKRRNSGILAAIEENRNASIDAVMRGILNLERTSRPYGGGWWTWYNKCEYRRAGTGTGVSGGFMILILTVHSHCVLCDE